MRLCKDVIERLYAYYRWTNMLEEDATPAGLVRFHTAHKMTLMAHGPRNQRELGRLVAEAGTRAWDELTVEYGRLFMETLGQMATPKKHSNVLHHLLGYLKNELPHDDKVELLRLIDEYRAGYLPLIVPLTLLKQYLRRYPVPEWIHQQVYLNPYPLELMLRNDV